MQGYEKFRTAITNFMIAQRKKQDITSSELEERYVKLLTGQELPQVTKARSKNWAIQEKIISSFIEIMEAYSALNDIEIYIKRFPYGHTSIYKTRYLNYHIENYLHEQYILKERLKTYMRRLKRIYKSAPKRKHKILSEISRRIEEDFDQLTKIRGKHVHKGRFTEKELSKASRLELAADLRDDDGKLILPVAKVLFDIQYKKTKTN